MSKEWKIAALTGLVIVINIGYEDENPPFEGEMLYVHNAISVEIKDPDTKEILEAWHRYQGMIRVNEVRPRISLCENHDLEKWMPFFSGVVTNVKAGDLVGRDRDRYPKEPEQPSPNKEE